MRPEVIVPLKGKKVEQEKMESKGLEVGSPIRIIREPYFGAIGKVTTLPSELPQIETEARVRVLEVELRDGKRVTLPRANVEMIEE
jgi:transcription antitermination factor NusG